LTRLDKRLVDDIDNCNISFHPAAVQQAACDFFTSLPPAVATRMFAESQATMLGTQEPWWEEGPALPAQAVQPDVPPQAAQAEVAPEAADAQDPVPE
jgi:hypothetical protein